MKRYRKILKSKIHRAVLTHADLHYEGSITLPPELMQAADIVEYEAVNVWNVTNGARLETYAITGEEGSRDIALNGAAARLGAPGDLLIIASFIEIDENEIKDFKPKIVFVDKDNRIVEERKEVPGPKRILAV
ncbi:MAG: aspartate 1-decarboxylase [Candidatus Dadabacteria bacterium]|nr:MAG: aspartate 1-decarboxylase [Candidatus Dadabacteria bacterium]